MSKYVGGRIVPKHCGTWNSTKEYETLSVVLYADTGDSYMSRKAVPAGVDISDIEYWAKSADYSAQLNAIASNVSDINEMADTMKAQIAANVAASTDTDADYAAEVVDARVDARGDTHTTLGERLRDHEMSFLCKKMEGLYIATTTGIRYSTHDSYKGNCTGDIGYDSSYGDIVLEKKYLVFGNSSVAAIAFYDKDKNVLSTSYLESDFTVEGNYAVFPADYIPEDTAYFGVSLSSSADSIWIRFSKGGILEEAEALVEAARVAMEAANRAQAFLEAVYHVDSSCSKNLLDTDSVWNQSGCYLSSGGEISSHASYFVTGYIPVTPGKTYYYSGSIGGAYCCIYDCMFERISSFQGPGDVEIPEDGVYVRLTCPVSSTTAMFMEKGYSESIYEPFCKPYDLYQTVTQNNVDTTAALDMKLDKEPGKNLFNKDSEDNIEGKYLNSGGSYGTNTAYYISHFIPVESGKTYHLNDFAVGGAYHCIFADDMVTVVEAFKDDTITIPDDGVYLRLSGVIDKIDTQQVEEGDSFTGYEAYTVYKPFTELEEELSGLIGYSPDDKLDKVLGKNFFNKDSEDIIEGSYLTSSGGIGSNSAYYISPFIPVEAGKTYYAYNFGVGGAYHCIYEDDMETVVSSFKTSPVTIPDSGAYVRLSGTVSNMDTQQFEEGDSYTGYEEFTEYYPTLRNTQRIEELERNFGSSLEVVLPGTLFFCAGVPLSIYDENILYKSYHDGADIYCPEAERTSRLMNFVFDDAGSGTIEMVVSRGLNKLSDQTFQYEAVDPSANSGKKMNLLFIGDSFTDGGVYLKEAKRLLEADGAEVTLLGTCGNSTFKAEGLSGGTLSNTFLTASAGVARVVEVTGVSLAPSTGYPGRTYVDDNGNSWTVRGSKIDDSGSGYMVVTKYQATEDDFSTFPDEGTLTRTDSSGEGDAAIFYSNPIAAYYNSFINPDSGELDISYYLDFWQFDNPDVVVLQFTWNDLSVWSSYVSTLASSFQTAVDHIHENLPETKVIISVEPCGSVFSGRDWDGKKYSVLNLVKALVDIFETEDYEDFCKIAPSYACVDLIYGYGTATVTPNSRYSSVTEISQGDGVHPSTGMYQIGDCLYPIITKLTS
ncbi:MAG: hypothetical protein LUG99_08995 [Lachnospiraceae bacterium]|nr:hypothetical protein [Lachnospiraceae bacterium]